MGKNILPTNSRCSKIITCSERYHNRDMALRLRVIKTIILGPLILVFNAYAKLPFENANLNVFQMNIKANNYSILLTPKRKKQLLSFRWAGSGASWTSLAAARRAWPHGEPWRRSPERDKICFGSTNKRAKGSKTKL